MVSLLITRIGKAIGRSGSAAEAYARLRRSGYLSRKALGEPEAVIAMIANASAQFLGTFSPAGRVPPGDECWRHVQPALLERGYIGRWGRLWGLQFTRR